MRKLLLTFVGAIAAFAATAQTTYTTKKDGSWGSGSTWVGGTVPAMPIPAGVTVNIKHDISFNLDKDLIISGTLNIDSDTLRFPSSFEDKVVVQPTGVLSVKNGGFLQKISPSDDQSDMEINSGRLLVENSTFTVSKSFTAKEASKITYRNSSIQVAENYVVDGASGKICIDTVQSSTLEVAINNGNFDVKDEVIYNVANATIIVRKGDFKVDVKASVIVLSGAHGNYGFTRLKTLGHLENNGNWNARIDAFCVDGDVKGSKAADIDFTRPEDCSVPNSAPAPELSFINPVLVKGTANKEGAEYRFSSVTTGVDAIIKLKKFSRSTIVMKTVDNSALGWNKAFQPEFGLPGVVPPNQDWYIDFEMSFYQAGTNTKKKVDKVDLTALDVDGDGWSISEYAIFSNPSNVSYSPSSSLNTVPAGSLGTSVQCGTCNVSSVLSQCLLCKGKGDILGITCAGCAGHGVLHADCSHPYTGIIGNVLQGPVQNFNNIDTNGTAVMATYQYADVDRINFRYGAKSGAYSSNGSGIRLNSLWSKSFALTPWTALPVYFANFGVIYDKGDAAISWKASHGEELKKFVVQRSTDGKTFTDIANVFAGNTTNYSYKDAAISSPTGVVYYRVASIDHTNETLYTSVKMIRLTKNELQTLALSTFPNPVVNDVRITLPQAWQGKPVVLQLISVNGSISKSIQLGAASQTETMSISNMQKGMYVVKAICGEEAAQQRIIKN